MKVLVINVFSLTVAGPNLGWLVGEDAVIKLAQVQVALLHTICA